jgi:acyl carrier protein phosphodiesterase
MNYLGHAVLSPDDPQILIGNLAGDSVRAIQPDILPVKVQQGLELHESIDAATDRSPGFRELRRMISGAGLPYAGVLADLMIDYALAASWEEHRSVSFALFKKRVYRQLERGAGLASQRFYFTASVLVYEDWFESYRTLTGMRKAFYRLNRKTRRPLPQDEIASFLTSGRTRVLELGLAAADYVAAELRLTGFEG